MDFFLIWEFQGSILLAAQMNGSIFLYVEIYIRTRFNDGKLEFV